MADDYEMIHMKEAQDHVQKHGVTGIEEFIKTKLEGWKNVEINIGITGFSGVGKSSFINAIRGLADDDEFAAEIGVTECTRDVAVYHHPINDKIIFWDLPGIGTPNYPDLETYVEKVVLERYDTFLIFTATRFTKNDLDLAERVKDINKSFFFIRTKIDQDYRNEKRMRAFNEEAMLHKIRGDCLKNLRGFPNADKIVFLISNHHPAKWDFGRLTQAILDVLPKVQRESLALCLASRSKEMLRRKVEILRGRIWMVAVASGAAAAVPLPGLSAAVDLALLAVEVNLYKTQLGLPDEKSLEFQQMTPENQERIRMFCITNADAFARFLKKYALYSAVEEVVRFIPVVGEVIAGGMSFAATYNFLKLCLNKLEETALTYLDELKGKALADFD